MDEIESFNVDGISIKYYGTIDVHEHTDVIREVMPPYFYRIRDVNIDEATNSIVLNGDVRMEDITQEGDARVFAVNFLFARLQEHYTNIYDVIEYIDEISLDIIEADIDDGGSVGATGSMFGSVPSLQQWEGDLKNYKITAYIKKRDELEPWQLEHEEDILAELNYQFRTNIQEYLQPVYSDIRQLDGDPYFFVAEVESIRDDNMEHYREYTEEYNSIDINELPDDYFDNLNISSEDMTGGNKKVYIAKNGRRYIKLANGQTRFISTKHY